MYTVSGKIRLADTTVVQETRNLIQYAIYCMADLTKYYCFQTVQTGPATWS